MVKFTRATGGVFYVADERVEEYVRAGFTPVLDNSYTLIEKPVEALKKPVRKRAKKEA